MDATKFSSETTPGPELQAWVRAGFVVQGTSLARWCKVNGVYRENAYQVLRGVYDGRKAKALRRRLIEAAWPNKKGS